jgi:aminotransferase
MNYWTNPYTDILHKHPRQECVRCVMDTSDPWITFDVDGVCSHCHKYDEFVADLGDEAQRQGKLDAIVARLKLAGRGKDYDCIMGLSGGVDSSYLAWYAVEKLGLRPLVVHVDAGWNSELAVNNIQNIVQRLKLDMHTLVIDWEEIKDLQLALFRSGVANLDVPQDHAFVASLYQEAKRYGIRDILNGGNLQTESILPNAWGYDASDAKSLLSIHRQLGEKALKTYPVYNNFKRFVYYPYIMKMRTHRPLEYINYSKEGAKKLLTSDLGWRDYGGKHYESVFTKFFQSYYLPVKFGYDKRRAHLASLVVSGQMTRESAKAELEEPPFDPMTIQDDKVYFAKKLGISLNEFESIMAERPKFYSDYPNSEKTYALLRKFARAVKSFVR